MWRAFVVRRRVARVSSLVAVPTASCAKRLETFERAERWRLNRDSALSDVQLLEGHEGDVGDCSVLRQEDKKKTTLGRKCGRYGEVVDGLGGRPETLAGFDLRAWARGFLLGRVR